MESPATFASSANPAAPLPCNSSRIFRSISSMARLYPAKPPDGMKILPLFHGFCCVWARLFLAKGPTEARAEGDRLRECAVGMMR